eukprot:6904123-Pyramimonas_sp.AAC.1
MEGEGSLNRLRRASADPCPLKPIDSSVLSTCKCGTRLTGANELSTMRQKTSRAGRKDAMGAINTSPESSA